MEREAERGSVTETLEEKNTQNPIQLQRCKLLKPLKGLWLSEITVLPSDDKIKRHINQERLYQP